MKKILHNRLINALADLRKVGLYNNIKTIEGPQGPWVMINGQKTLNLCSNNFLGYANDPKIKVAAKKGIDLYGCGPGAVRTISGTLQAHVDFENALAKWKGQEAAIVVQTGFIANTTLIPAIFIKGDAIISDQLNHASIIDGMKLSKASRFIFKHADMNDLEMKLKEIRANPEITGIVVIISDGVFSMDGDIANLPAIVKLAKKYDAYTYVDDAWGEFGLGNGQGTVAHHQLEGKIDFEVGTLSKGFGLSGGFIAGDAMLIEYLRQRARPFLFSTGLNVSTCVAGLAVIEDLQNSNARITKLWENVSYFKNKIKDLGLNAKSPTHIIPIMVQEEKIAQKMSKMLLNEKVFVTPILFPTVARGTARCRIIISAAHTKKDLDFGIEKIAKVSKELGLIK